MNSTEGANVSDTTLCVIHPEELGSSANALGVWLATLGIGGRSGRGPEALYATTHATSRGLADQVADRLWLPVRLIEAPCAAGADAYLAGVIDQLGRQHAGGWIPLIGPRAALAGALVYLSAQGRFMPHALSLLRYDEGGAP